MEQNCRVVSDDVGCSRARPTALLQLLVVLLLLHRAFLYQFWPVLFFLLLLLVRARLSLMILRLTPLSVPLVRPELVRLILFPLAFCGSHAMGILFQFYPLYVMWLFVGIPRRSTGCHFPCPRAVRVRLAEPLLNPVASTEQALLLFLVLAST